MEQFRDWFIEYCDECWKEVPKGFRYQKHLGFMFEFNEPFEMKYEDKLITLPLVTLNKMNEWSLHRMGFAEPVIRKTDLSYLDQSPLNEIRIDFPHLHFYTKDEMTDRIIKQIIRSFAWTFRRFIEKENGNRLYAYLSSKKAKFKYKPNLERLDSLKEIFEWSYLSKHRSPKAS
jgi:hypothetical protein